MGGSIERATAEAWGKLPAHVRTLVVTPPEAFLWQRAVNGDGRLNVVEPFVKHVVPFIAGRARDIVAGVRSALARERQTP